MERLLSDTHGSTSIKKYWNGYSFDEDGIVYNKDGSIKAVSDNGKGYPITGFYFDGKLTTRAVHKVVAELWLGECPEGYEVDHINNNRWDFRPSNLRYVSKSENNQKSYDSGNRDVTGEKNANSKLLLKDVICIRDLYDKGETSLTDIAVRYNVTKQCIHRIVKRKSWRNV